MERMIAFYNEELDRYNDQFSRSATRPDPEDIVDKTPTKIKWTRELFSSVKSGKHAIFDLTHIVKSEYRPFSMELAYFDRHFNNCIYKMPRFYPHNGQKNISIVIT